MRSLDPLGGISVFIKVAETLNFSRAAAQLGLSKATVSVQLKELEARLGVRLLHRNNRRVALTEAGEIYKRALNGVIPQVTAAEREAKSYQEEAVGLLRISAPPDFGQRYLASAVGEFTKLFPDVSVQMVLSAEKVDLIEEGFDLAIRLTIDTDDNLIVRRLATTELIACASEEYLSTASPINAPPDLLDHACLHFSPIRWGKVWRFRKSGHEESVLLRPKIEANDSFFLKECALSGAGVALLPEYVVGADLLAGQLVRILSEWDIADIPVHAVYPANRHIAPKVRYFVDFLAKFLKKAMLPINQLAGHGT